MKKYRARFLDQPVLTLPLSDQIQYSFNPNNLVPLDENSTFYPTTRVTDEWGILEVSDGALLIREAGRATRIVVGPPNDLNERPLKGPGWELQLKEGWEVVPAERKGSVVLKRTASPVSGGGTATEVLRMARQIAAAAGAEIWPGFEINKYSSLVTEAGSTLIRFTNGPDNTSGQVFMSIGDDYFQQHSLDEGLNITFHEAFHGFERDRNREGAKWRTENSTLFSEYPDSAATSNALFSIEGKILYSALHVTDPSTLKIKAREFIAVRKLRQSGLEARFVEYERGAESNEGLAEYAGSKAVVAAIEANTAKKTSLPLSDRDGQTYLLRKFEKLKLITRIGKNSRLRFYYTGAAQAFLLDRLMPNWKSRVQLSGNALQELVEEAAQYSPVAGETARILAQYGHPAILQEEEAASAKRASERQALLDSILNQPGRKYVIDVSALSKMGAMRQFDPMNATLIGKQKRVHTRILNVGQDGVYEAQFSQPVVEDPENLEYITISKADQKQEIVVDGELLEPAKFAQKRFEKKLTIVSTGFTFEARAGVVKITDDGIFVGVAAPK